VVGIVVIYNFSTAPADTDIFHVATPWIAASFTLMMITNIILSGKYFFSFASQEVFFATCSHMAN